jgi:hypothetical protein
MKETRHVFLKTVAVCFVLLIIFLSNGCAVTCVFEPSPLDVKLTSPNKTYEIQLKEEVEIKDNFWSCYGNHFVKMTVTKNQQSFISDEVI